MRNNQWKPYILGSALPLLLILSCCRGGFGQTQDSDPEGLSDWLSAHFAKQIESRDEQNESELRKTPPSSQGWAVLYVIGVVHTFVGLAIVCNEYFVPALETIIDKLGIQKDVGGATLMAIVGSAPELFTTVIGVFISQDDTSIGPLVGSAAFDFFVVVGICGIFSTKTGLNLSWWSLFRDSFFYAVALITLTYVSGYNRIEWYGATLLLLVYVAYLTFMKFNQRAENLIKRLLCKNPEVSPKEDQVASELTALQNNVDDSQNVQEDSWMTTWRESNRKKQVTSVLVLPITIPLYLTLPDNRTQRGTMFLLVWGYVGSILWIAVFSYFMVTWMDRTIEILGISPEIMGMGVLTLGTSLPELITSVNVAKKGFGDMVVSSAIGANIFDICVGLGLPWLIESLYFMEAVPVQTSGMFCYVILLFGMLCFMVMSITCFRWRLSTGLGLVMLVLYSLYVAIALLLDYNIISCPKF